MSVEEIEDLFRGTLAVYADPSHSLTGQCLRAIGRTAAGRAVIVAFTLRRKVDLSPPDQRPLHACQGGASP